MKLFLLAAMSGAIISCGGSFFSDSSGAGGSGPDASAGGAGGDTSGSAGGTTSTGGTTASGGVGMGGSVVTGASGSADSGGSSGSGGTVGSGGVPGTGGSTGGRGGAAGRAGSGGSAGSIVDAGRDTGAGDAGGPTCKIDSHCKLVDDCCLGCLAKEATFVVPPCPQQCLINPCAGHQVKGVRCSQGKCTLAAECDSSVVTCMAPTPACPPGEVPSISGTCWTGQCVKASQCRTVKDCASCDPNFYVCGSTTTQLGNQVRCVDTPPVCGMDRSCSCAGSYVCMAPYSSCSSGPDPGGSHIVCSCPNC